MSSDTKQSKQSTIHDVSSCTSDRIDVENSQSYWSVNANFPNNWTLQKDYFILGKSWGHDKTGFHIYGSVNEIMYGDDKGKIEADIPWYDEETESDRLVLGIFDTVDEAMKAVLERNFPEFSSNYF